MNLVTCLDYWRISGHVRRKVCSHFLTLLLQFDIQCVLLSSLKLKWSMRVCLIWFPLFDILHLKSWFYPNLLKTHPSSEHFTVWTSHKTSPSFGGLLLLSVILLLDKVYYKNIFSATLFLYFHQFDNFKKLNITLKGKSVNFILIYINYVILWLKIIVV